MSVVRASETDLDNLHRLLQSAHYKFADFGPEDLPLLLSKSVAMIGRTDEKAWGFICLQPEDRPSTLPEGAPARCYFRALALRAGYPPSNRGTLLLASAIDLLRDTGAMQIVAYGGEAWAVNLLHEAGFATADQVQFYEMPRPHSQMRRLPETTHMATLRPAQSSHLHRLAELDAAAFPPLWHFGHNDMLELLVRTRLTVALLEDDGDDIAGYTATVANSDEELQLARLAVRPDLQGHGIGRQLLSDVLGYAAAQRYKRVILNTQTNNERSQRLYRAYGFRPVGRPIPVLTKLIGVPGSTDL